MSKFAEFSASDGYHYRPWGAVMYLSWLDPAIDAQLRSLPYWAQGPYPEVLQELKDAMAGGVHVRHQLETAGAKSARQPGRSHTDQHRLR